MKGHHPTSALDDEQQRLTLSKEAALRDRMNSKQAPRDYNRKSPPMSSSALTDFADSIPIAITMSQDDDSCNGEYDAVDQATSNEHAKEGNEESVWAMVGDSSEEPSMMPLREIPTYNEADRNFHSPVNTSIVTSSTIGDEKLPRSIPREVSRQGTSAGTPLSLLGASVGVSVMTSSCESETETKSDAAGVARIHKLPGELLSTSGASIISSSGAETEKKVEKLPGELLSLSGASIASSSLVGDGLSSACSIGLNFGDKHSSSQDQTPSEIALNPLSPKLRTLLDTSLSVASSAEKDSLSETPCPSDEDSSSTRVSREADRVFVDRTPQRFLQQWSVGEVDGNEADISLLKQSLIESEQGSRACNETRLSLPSLKDSVPGTPPPKLDVKDLGSASSVSPLTRVQMNALHLALEESEVYIRKIDELEEALRVANTKTDEESAKRKQCEQVVQKLKRQALLINGKTESAPENPRSSSLPEDSLLERNKTLVKEVRFADQACVELSEKNLALENRVKQLQSDLKQARSERASLHQEIVRSNRQGAKSEAMLEAAQEQLADQQNRFEVDLKSARSQLEQSQERVNELRNELEEAKSDKSRFEGQIAALSQECLEAKLTAANLSENMPELPDDSEAAIASVNDSYRPSQKNAQKEIGSLREHCDKLSSEIASERCEKNNVIAERDALHAETVRLKKQLTASQEMETLKKNTDEGSNDAAEGVSIDVGTNASWQGHRNCNSAALLLDCETMIHALELKLVQLHEVRASQQPLSSDSASEVENSELEEEGIRENLLEVTQSPVASVGYILAKIHDFSRRLSKMSLSLNGLRDAANGNSQSDIFGDSLALSCSVVSGYYKLDGEAGCDDLMNATLNHLSCPSQETYDEERMLEMMEEARLQEHGEPLASPDDEVSGILHIDGLSQLGEDISTIGSMFMDSPFNPRNPSSRQNQLQTFEEERKEWEEEKRVLSDRLASAQVEYQKLKDSISCHQEKMKEHHKMKCSLESQSQMVEILEKKVAKLSREKQDLHFSLLKAQKDYDSCRKSLAELSIKQPTKSADFETQNAPVSGPKEEDVPVSHEPEELQMKLAALKEALRVRQLEHDKIFKECKNLSVKVETLKRAETGYKSKILNLEQSLHEKELEMDKLHMAFAASKEKLIQATEQNASEDSLVSHFESALQAAEKAFQESSGEAAAAKSNAESIRGEKEELLRVVKDLEDKLEAANGTIGELRMRVSKQSFLENEMVAANDKLEKVEEQYASSESVVVDLKTKLQEAKKACEVSVFDARAKQEELTAKICSIEQKLVQANKDIREKSRRIVALENENSDLCEKNRRAESSIADASSGRNKLIKLVDNLDAKLKQKESENQVDKVKISTLKAHFDSAQAELQKAQAACQALENKLVSEKAAAAEAAAEMSRLTTLHSTCKEELAELAEMNKGKEALVCDLERAVQTEQKTAERFAAEAAAANSLATSLRDDAETLKATVETLHRELGEAREIINKKLERSGVLQSELDQLREKYDDGVSSIDDLIRGRNELSTHIRELEIDKAQISEERDEAKEELGATLGQMQSQKQALDEALEQCAEQKMLVEQLQGSMRQTSSEMEKLKVSYLLCNDELAKVSERNAEYEAVVSQTKAELDVANAEMTRMEKELVDLRAQLDGARKQSVESSETALKFDLELNQKTEEFAACQQELENCIAEKDDLICTLRTKCSEMQSTFEERIASISEKHESHVSELDKERTRAKMLEEQLVLAETEIARADEEIAKSSQVLLEMQEELGDAQEERDRLSDAHRNARERDAHILREASEARVVMNARLKETESSVSILMKKLEEYSTRMESLEQQLMRAEDELRRKDEENNLLKTKNSSLERKCLRLREYISQLTTKCEEWATSYKRQSRVLEKVESQRVRAT